jgi:hypothetical protein
MVEDSQKLNGDWIKKRFHTVAMKDKSNSGKNSMIVSWEIRRICSGVKAGDAKNRLCGVNGSFLLNLLTLSRKPAWKLG